MNPSKFTVVRHLMDRLASELAIGRGLQRRIAGMPASHRRDVLEQYLGETLGHAERVRTRLLALGGSDERAGLGTRLAAAVTARTRAVASASSVRFAGSGGNARGLDEAMDDCAAVAREIAAYVALARLSHLAGDDVTADLAAEHLADEERMLQRLLTEVSELAETLSADVPAPAPLPTPRTAQGRRAQRTSRGAPARYDGVPENQVIARLGELSQVDLERLAEHERHHRNRVAVLDRIDALQGDEPWLGYDALNVASVRSALEGASREQLDTVHDYERVHKNRDTVLKAAAR